MNVPGIKHHVLRRLQLIWIVPYIIVAFIPLLVWHGLKTLPAMCREVPESLIAVWKGRNRW